MIKNNDFINKINKKRFLEANKKYLYVLIGIIFVIASFGFLVEDKIGYIASIMMSLLCGVLASAIVLAFDKKNWKISKNLINKKEIINTKYEQYEKLLTIFYKIQNLSNNENFDSIFSKFRFHMYNLTVTGNILSGFKSKDNENKYYELRRIMCQGFDMIHDMSSLKSYVDANIVYLEEIQNLLSSEFFNCIDDELVQEKDILQ